MKRSVDRLLELYYIPRSRTSEQAKEIRLFVESDGWLSRCREQMLFLLDGHPSPFDKTATATLMGTMVADAIRDLDSFETKGFLDLAGRVHRLRGRMRRHALERKISYWPVELTPGFPCEPCGPSDEDADDQSDGIVADLPIVRGLLTESQLATVRQGLHRVPNPLGLVLVKHLMAFDCGPVHAAISSKAKAGEAAIDEAWPPRTGRRVGGDSVGDCSVML